MQLIESEITSREILDWRGLQIFHGWTSSCSQKLRIFLNLKGVEWQGHVLNLAEGESYSEWFLGINPRGLVPVLVLDGAVHIESNDILALLEKTFPEPCLFPAAHGDEIVRLLRHEDDLHLDLRTLSFRFVFGRTGSPKTPALLDRYRGGNRTVNGIANDPSRAHELEFYERLAAQGITDEAIRTSAAKFRAAFEELEQRLSAGPYYLGQRLSILDIAWFVYASRLKFGGYPFARLHPRVDAWRRTLAQDERFSREVELPKPVRENLERNHQAWMEAGSMFSDITGF